ncbi:MAG TPA: PRC-barrel domain-containing protein [Burkholderiales bacterium]|nr:PRC-barrel domain-containing protein [Burkholderiales bacterium]
MLRKARAAVLLCLLAAPAAAQDLFARLDENRDGYLTGRELRIAVATEAWIAEDRDRDGRVSRDEFSPPGDGLPSGVRATQLLGMPVHDRVGEHLGEVRDLLIDGRGRVLALSSERARVPWHALRIEPLYVRAASFSEPADGWKLWRASELLGARVQVGLPAREAVIDDFVILDSGDIASVVLREGQRSSFYPWSRVWKGTKETLHAGDMPP